VAKTCGTHIDHGQVGFVDEILHVKIFQNFLKIISWLKKLCQFLSEIPICS